MKTRLGWGWAVGAAAVVGGLTLGTAAMAAERPARKAREPGGEAPAPKVEPGKVFVYKQSAGKAQELEVYFPKDWSPSNKVPGLILFHGGGWTGGTLDQFRYACRYFATRGLVAATANYRMLAKAEQKGLPAGESYKRVCVTDTKTAIRWFKQHAGELGIDPKRVITGGGSAGGHVSVLATTTPGLDDPSDLPGFDTSVVAYVLFNPAFHESDAGDPPIDVLRHLRADLPPAIMFFGTEDDWKKGADAAFAKLKELGNKTTEMWLAKGEKHGFFNKPPWQDVTIAAADRFLAGLGLLKGECTLPAPAGGEALERQP
ncbi:MAG: alpha/beta hydrolase [Lentisphaerae bacterium]|nr:alpha/beta hydrolase [Lentisphaerota bacterium]